MNALNNIKMNKYDVIIVGAGVGGIICGCYLAKAGLKVLILEKNDRPGGYCASFNRNGLIFDVGIDRFVNCSEGEIFDIILNEIGIKKFKSMKVVNPSIILDADGKRFSFNDDLSYVVSQFQKAFPNERNNIESFFDLIKNKKFLENYFKYKDISFEELLNSFFIDADLKNAIKMTTLYVGLSASKLPATVAIEHIRGHVFNASYCPKSSSLNFIINLVNKYKEYGGDIYYSSEVKKIILENDEVKGVKTKNKTFFSNIVVSNSDAFFTYKKLIGLEKLPLKFKRKLDKLKPAISLFIVYLGVNKSLNTFFNNCSTVWYFEDFNPDLIYENVNKGKVDYNLKSLIFLCPSIYKNKIKNTNVIETLTLIVGAPFKNKDFWKKNKNKYRDIIINKAKKIIPILNDSIVFKEAATPQTLFKYTNNLAGSYRGWLCAKDQIGEDILPNKSKEIKGLYFAGHWTTTSFGQGGISMAAYSGKKTANIILRKIK